MPLLKEKDQINNLLAFLALFRIHSILLLTLLLGNAESLKTPQTLFCSRSGSLEVDFFSFKKDI